MWEIDYRYVPTANDSMASQMEGARLDQRWYQWNKAGNDPSNPPAGPNFESWFGSILGDNWRT